MRALAFPYNARAVISILVWSWHRGCHHTSTVRYTWYLYSTVYILYIYCTSTLYHIYSISTLYHRSGIDPQPSGARAPPRGGARGAGAHVHAQPHISIESRGLVCLSRSVCPPARTATDRRSVRKSISPAQLDKPKVRKSISPSVGRAQLVWLPGPLAGCPGSTPAASTSRAPTTMATATPGQAATRSM
eukprot:COSAG02_NODE_990_length_15413_cov_24.707457_4_plen_189_part_00